MVRAFLIGAGATRAQYPGAPLSTNFMTRLRDDDDQLFKHIERIVNINIEPHKLIDLDLEMLMGMSYNFPSSIKDDLLESLHLAIYKLLSIATGIDDSGIYVAISAKKHRPPTRFKRLLSDNRLSTKDFFMTLNYDLDLDCEIIRMQNSIDYGIPDNMIHNREGINPNKNQEF